MSKKYYCPDCKKELIQLHSFIPSDNKYYECKCISMMSTWFYNVKTGWWHFRESWKQEKPNIVNKEPFTFR